jgi:hypothetical protein
MLHPLLAGCCLQSHEIWSNKGMKYWDSGLSAPSLRTFITTVHIPAAAIGWRRSGKERTGQTQFSTKFAAKQSFTLPWSPVYFFSLFLEISSHGIPVPSFLDFTDNLSNIVHVQRLVGPLFDGLKLKKFSNFKRIVCKRRVFFGHGDYWGSKKDRRVWETSLTKCTLKNGETSEQALPPGVVAGEVSSTARF